MVARPVAERAVEAKVESAHGSIRLFDEVRPRTEIEQRYALRARPAPERLVVREDVPVLLQGDVDDGVVAAGVGRHDLAGAREGQRGLRVLVVQMLKLPDQRAGDHEPDLAEDLPHREVEVDADLERHQQSVRVEHDGLHLGR